MRFYMYQCPSDASMAVSSEVVALTSAAASACGAWAAAHALQSVEVPRAMVGASSNEVLELASDAAALLRRGDDQLREAIVGVRADSVDRGRRSLSIRPLAALLTLPLPIPELLESLTFESVVVVNVLALLCPGWSLAPPVYPAACPEGWAMALAGGAPPHDPMRHAAVAAARPLILHVLPRWDSVSNAVRQTRLPLCTASAFLWLVGRAASKLRHKGGSPPIVRMVDVGPNLGDCPLAALRLLSGSWDLRVALFEPQPEAAAALRRSSYANDFSHSLGVFEQALGADRGVKVSLGVPHSTSAEATIVDCARRYEVCSDMGVEMETVDGVLGVGAGFLGEGSPGVLRGPPGTVLDILKVHVQGFDTQVLSGARKSLNNGVVCVVFARVQGLGLAGARSMGEAKALAQYLLNVLNGFRVVLTVGQGRWNKHLKDLYGVELAPSGYAWNATGHAPRVLASHLRALWQDLHTPLTNGKLRSAAAHYGEIVAWREDGRCASSPGVLAARDIWGHVAVGVAHR